MHLLIADFASVGLGTWALLGLALLLALAFEFVNGFHDTANAVAEAERAERQRKAEQKMKSDPFVMSMMREFGATIVPGSIQAL